jgi:hypothetical protein
LLKGGNGRFLLQALSKTMNIKIDKKSEALLKEMLRKTLVMDLCMQSLMRQ